MRTSEDLVFILGLLENAFIIMKLLPNFGMIR